MEFDELSHRVIGCAVEVHRTLGPGLLESAYEQCLAHELSLMQIPFKLEESLPVEYKGIRLDCGYRADIVVRNQLIVPTSFASCSSSLRGATLPKFLERKA